MDIRFPRLNLGETKYEVLAFISFSCHVMEGDNIRFESYILRFMRQTLIIN